MPAGKDTGRQSNLWLTPNFSPLRPPYILGLVWGGGLPL